MITTFQDFTSDDTEPRSRNRLTTRSLRDDEIRAIADANYRGDNPLRFDCVRQGALMFERAGYSISLSPEVSPWQFRRNRSSSATCSSTRCIAPCTSAAANSI
jgi:hypothetical protein